MYEDFFNDFDTEWELDNIKNSKSKMIIYCNDVQSAIMGSNVKWERILKDLENNKVDLLSAWMRAIGEGCGFCKTFGKCSNCLIYKPCMKMCNEFDSMEDDGLDRERFIALVESILMALDDLSSDVYHYKLGIIRDITGVPEYDNNN